MIKPIDMREADFKRQVWEHKYPESLKDEFFQYWSEPNKSNTRMKFEMEKTWHLGRRLARWANNGFGKIETKQVVIPVKKEIITDMDKVDAFFQTYRAHPTQISFKEFGTWYPLLKNEGLLRRFTALEIEQIKEIYNCDNEKCRCAVVQLTFDEMAKTGMTFEKMKARL